MIAVTTESSLANVTNGNVSNATWDRRHHRHDHPIDIISDHYKTGILVVGSLNASLAILVNLTLVVIILSTRDLRRSVFHWNILNICAAGILSGFIVIPFTVNRYHVEQWLHGSGFCTVFAILDYMQLVLPAISIICTHFNRLVKLQKRKNPLLNMKCFQLNIMQYVFFAFPWIFALFVCVPILAAGRRDTHWSARLLDSVCFHVLKREYFPVLLGVMLLGPVCVVILLCIITAINLKLSEVNWMRMTEASKEGNDVKETRSTIKCLLASSVIFLMTWGPFAFLVFSYFICGRYIRSRSCWPPEIAYLVCYQLGSAGTFGVQLPWFWLTEIRTRLTDSFETGSSRARNALDNVRKMISNGPMVVEWTSKQSELMAEDK